ncbi:hypothetical protein PN36_26665 [Candidatus Thiomargarita nelsonii]|uniref:LamG-like jellyroll fold domain-containing protein n=1 Tax=Candidatus Thiomargarita nelsonii TaxID=1003181 RepID=A0A4E0QKS7_9GAMM|nr:hypothetical protein PN36_26665 [Candidatus Thiomargarita nelsonii]
MSSYLKKQTLVKPANFLSFVGFVLYLLTSGQPAIANLQDGKVVWKSDRVNPPQLFVQNVSQPYNRRQVTSDIGTGDWLEVRHPDWSPNGQYIVYVGQDIIVGDNPNDNIVDVLKVIDDQGTLQPCASYYALDLMGVQSISYPYWSNDGKRIAFTYYQNWGERGIGVIEFDTPYDFCGNHTTYTVVPLGVAPGDLDATDPVFSPYDTHIYFHADSDFMRGGIYRVPATGGTPTPISDNNGAPIELGFQISISPDGERLIYNSEQWRNDPVSYLDEELMQVDLLTNIITQITQEPGNQYGNFAKGGSGEFIMQSNTQPGLNNELYLQENATQNATRIHLDIGDPGNAYDDDSAGWWISAAHASSCLYGIDSGINNNFTTTLYDIDPITGLAFNPRNTGIGNAIGLEWGPGGNFLYTVTTAFGTSSNPDSLYRINPTTGVSQFVGFLNIGTIFEGDLAVHPSTGVLYGIGGVGSFGETLYTIDWNGQANIKGHPAGPNSDYSYLSFHDNGTLYAIDNTMTPGQLPTQLVTLNPATGQILTSQTLTPALGGSGGMDFDPATGLFSVVDGQEAGSVYAGARALYTLNTTLPALALRGPTGLTDHFSGVVGCAPTSCTTPPPNMVAWWPLDETSGTTAAELVNSNDGTHHNGPVPVPGMVDGGLQFDGVDDYVQVPDNHFLDLGAGQFTIDFWIYPKLGETMGTVIRKGVPTGPLILASAGYHLFYNNGHFLAFFSNGSSGFQMDLSPNFTHHADPGEWTFVAVTIDLPAQQVKLYIDGVFAKATSIPSFSNISNSEPLIIGGYELGPSTDRNFNGILDEIEFFNRVITQSEIQDIYNAGSYGKCQELVHVPWDRRPCIGESSVTINATVCNNSIVPQTYQLSSISPSSFDSQCNFIPTPPVINYTVLSPTPLIVNPGQCDAFLVRIDMPAGMTGSDTACYMAIGNNVNTGLNLSNEGSILGPTQWCLTSDQAVLNALDLSQPTGVIINVTNTGDTAELLDYTLVPVRSDMDESREVSLSLNGQEPGNGISGELFLDAGESGEISFIAALTQADPFSVIEAILMTDLDGDGIQDPLYSTAFLYRVIGGDDNEGNDDVIIDFGPGIGLSAFVSNSDWVMLHNMSPESMVTGDIDGNGQDDVIVDFGSQGILVWMNNSTWVPLHTLSPESMVTGDIDGNGLDDVIIDFGSPYGIWLWMNNSSWVKLHPLSPESMTTGDMDGNGLDDVIIDFGEPYGIWIRMNNSSWTQLHSLSSQSMTTGDMDGNGLDEVIIDFGSPYGIWVRMNNSSWTQLHSLSANSMITGDMDGNGLDEVIIDFGSPYGIWVRMNNSTWVKLHSLSPQSMTTGDMDSNGLDDVIIDFGSPNGIWVRMNNSNWVQLHTISGEGMVTGNIDGLASVSSNTNTTTQEIPAAELDNAEPLPEAEPMPLPTE